MRAPALLVLSGLALGAAACAGVEPAPPAASPLSAPATAPAPIENYDWLFFEEGDEASLGFGLDESDDVWLDLDCRRGSGRLVLVAPAGPDAPRLVRLEAGGERAAYRAEVEASELHEGVFLIADAPTADPVFQRFRALGWMTIEQEGEAHAMVPHPGSAARIERFFAFCG
ncbi:hypothetical protein [Brevundimonas sp.]|uniref:hypothetical protein n=1 Tax=Brevundimonas sp. TaxID=1871086 RepID=UPI002D61599F|nr:hypothetical protein [Brevundimonas sp.]HYC66775.1 hypothetical protein [Brevundimonas sp.]